MPYCTPSDVRLRAVGLTEEVVPDVSSSGLNLTTCIGEAEAEIDEAGRAGDYEVPFDPVPERIRDLTAIGALARARRALQSGNQPQVGEEHYRSEFEAGLVRLRRGEMDLGTVVVSGEELVMAETEGDWAQLAHRGVVLGSARVTSQEGGVTYLEDRGDYQPDYRPGEAKDYRVDHRLGGVRWLMGGRVGPGETVLVTYDYFRRQPGLTQDAEYAGRTAASDRIYRGDEQG
jgi:hypothetical protein